ncbi:MAG: hypothetical protein ABR598_00310 [Candidatus Dormibacteria bacterium]
MNRKLLAPGAAGLAFAAGCLGVQAGITGPVRQPVNSVLDGIFGTDGLSVQGDVNHQQVRTVVPRPQLDPTFDSADATAQQALDLAGAAAPNATDIANGEVKTINDTAQGALSVAAATAGTAKAVVDPTAATSGAASTDVPSPVGPAQWNERQLLQRSVSFDTANVTAHSVEIKSHKMSDRMYALQIFVDGQQSGNQVNVYSTSLKLDSLDIPVVVPGAAGNIDLAISYGYNATGSTCVLSIGNDDAACAAAAPDAEALAKLSPEVTVDLGWKMLGLPAGSSSVRTPLH